MNRYNHNVNTNKPTTNNNMKRKRVNSCTYQNPLSELGTRPKEGCDTASSKKSWSWIELKMRRKRWAIRARDIGVEAADDIRKGVRRLKEIYMVPCTLKSSSFLSIISFWQKSPKPSGRQTSDTTSSVCSTFYFVSGRTWLTTDQSTQYVQNIAI